MNALGRQELKASVPTQRILLYQASTPPGSSHVLRTLPVEPRGDAENVHPHRLMVLNVV